MRNLVDHLADLGVGTQIDLTWPPLVRHVSAVCADCVQVALRLGVSPDAGPVWGWRELAEPLIHALLPTCIAWIARPRSGDLVSAGSIVAQPTHLIHRGTHQLLQNRLRAAPAMRRRRQCSPIDASST
jgi:hypothetical protein